MLCCNLLFFITLKHEPQSLSHLFYTLFFGKSIINESIINAVTVSGIQVVRVWLKHLMLLLTSVTS